MGGGGRVWGGPLFQYSSVANIGMWPQLQYSSVATIAVFK